MVAYPWYLLAVGLVIVVIGALLAGLSGLSRPQQPLINHKMKDREIIERLGREQRIPFANLVLLIGVLCIAASLVWRLLRVVAPNLRI
jgi:hypothetical protein